MIIAFNNEDFLNFGNLSIIKFLLKKTDISFLQIKKLFREKKIKVNNKKIDDKYLLQSGDNITIFNYKNLQDENDTAINQLSKQEKSNYSKELIRDIKNNIIHEDENLIFLNKKRGICVQGGSGISYSLVDILSFIYKTEIRIVHRIDKETEGIIVFAKNYKSANEITALFEQKKIQKTYFAITEGVPNKQEGQIDADIFYKELNVKKNAITNYEVIEKRGNFALLKISPQTGRKHQIRIHLAGINCPILGDIKYNKNKSVYPMQLYSFAIKIPNYKEISIDYKQIITFFKTL